MKYNIKEFRKWFEQNVKLSEAYSVDSLRSIAHHILMGRNYRLITENNTKSKLFFTYLWLSDVMKNAKKEFGNNWKEDLINDLINNKSKEPEQKKLLYWLLGLTYKTSVNLSMSTEDFPSVMIDLISHLNELFKKIGRENEIDNAWLLMMAGSATLNIRGADKAKIGKQIERVLIRTVLSMLGLKENKNFWLNLQRDLKVDREADAEIETKRGKLRLEVCLISSGNQEVTEDKISRVGKNGIILFDKVGNKTRIYETANRNSVKLIQMRNNQPLVEVYNHILPLVSYNLKKPPTLEKDIRSKIDILSDDVFKYSPEQLLKKSKSKKTK